MKFSIVTVCFNAEAVVRAAMQSLERQTCPDYEWIVVDGASTDRTLDIVREFRGQRLRLVSEPDKGIYDAMNKAVGMARGDYLFFLNADDELADAEVLRGVSHDLERAPADLLVGRIVHVVGERRVLRDFSHLSRRALMMDSLCHQATFARREWFGKIGLFDLNYRIAADYDWFLRSFDAGAKVEFSERLVCRFRGDGAHHQAAERTRIEIAAVRSKHAGALGAWGFGLWRQVRHYARRLTGRAPRGHHLQR